MNSEVSNRKAPQEISFNDLLIKMKRGYRVLLSKWQIILLFILLGGGIGYAYAYFKKPIYIAITTFVLEDSNSTPNTLGSLGGLASMVGLDLGSGGGIFQGDNIIELYKSRTMIEKTLLSEYTDKKQLLVDRYIVFNNLKTKWNKREDLKRIQFTNLLKTTRLQDSILGVVVEDIKENYLNVSKPDKKLSIINVEVRSPDESFAKAFNDQIVKNVNDFYVQTKTKKSLDNIFILQQKVDSVRSVMNGAIYSAAAIVDATPNLNPTHQLQRVVPVQRSQFNAETNKAILGELVKNLELSKMSLRKETPLIQVVDGPILPLTKIGFGRLKGVFFGAVLTGFITVLVILMKNFLKTILV